MKALRRHQLACLNETGWQQALAQAVGGPAKACVSHWARHRLPLVVTRQPGPGQPSGGLVALGLPAPGRWQRQRLALGIDLKGVAFFDEFPKASAVAKLLSRGARAPWLQLCAALDQTGARTRVYGSHGWQLLTGLDHLRPGSDLDVLVHVSTPDEADHAAALLTAHALTQPAPRLDGELVFGNGAAVAWREWSLWRAGRVNAVLVKHTRGADLCHAEFWNTARPSPESALPA